MLDDILDIHFVSLIIRIRVFDILVFVKNTFLIYVFNFNILYVFADV